MPRSSSKQLSRSSSKQLSRSSSKQLSRSIFKSSSKKLSISNKTNSHELANITGLALKWVIANILLMVRDAGFIIHQSESIVLAGSYKFYIQNKDIDPPSSNIISSVDIASRWDNTILEIPRTRSLKRITADIFYIQLVQTNPNNRNKGWATLLLIYTIAYLQIEKPGIKIFILSDESANSRHIKNNIYDRLGFIYMYHEAMDISQPDITIPTSQKKILDFNIEPIYSWATVRCLHLINDIRRKDGMSLIEPFNPYNPIELVGGKSKKQIKRTRKQAKRTRKYSKKHTRKQGKKQSNFLY